MPYTEGEGRFTTSDGVPIRYRFWFSGKIDPEKVIVIHHGFGEHSGRYWNLLDAMEDTGITFFGLDIRGHGDSGGARGDATGIQQMADDFATFLDVLQEHHDVAHPMLFAHSMGAVIVLYMLTLGRGEENIRGVALSNPALRVHFTPLMVLKKLAGVLLRHTFPRLRMRVGLPIQYLSHDPKVLKSYHDDPRVHGFMSTTLAMDMLIVGKKIIEAASNLHIPIYLALSPGDRITNSNGSMDFYLAVSSTDRVLKTYPNLYHEIINETLEERTLVLADLRKWFLDQFQNPV